MTAYQELAELLKTEMSRRNTDMVSDLVFQKPELFEELVRLYLANEEPVSRRAAWVTDLVSEQQPELILPHLARIIAMLPSFRHDGLKRHSMRILARSPLPGEEHLGEMIRIAFDWLLSGEEAVATKVYCMELLYRVSQVEPDLKKELADSIEWRMEEETAGFRNRGQKLLRKLYREMWLPSAGR